MDLDLQRFNSQPPEGGWSAKCPAHGLPWRFQLTAARRRLASTTRRPMRVRPFQLTAARRRLGTDNQRFNANWCVSTHSRPKAAGISGRQNGHRRVVSTHSRPKAAGTMQDNMEKAWRVSTHSRPKAAGKPALPMPARKAFQLTAARRRLAASKSATSAAT